MLLCCSSNPRRRWFILIVQTKPCAVPIMLPLSALIVTVNHLLDVTVVTKCLAHVDGSGGKEGVAAASPAPSLEVTEARLDGAGYLEQPSGGCPLCDFNSISPPEHRPLPGRAVPAPPPPPRQRRRCRCHCARPRPCPGGATLGWGWARSLHGTARCRQCRSLAWTRRRPRRATAARSTTEAASGGRDPRRWDRERDQQRSRAGSGAWGRDAPALPPWAGVFPHLFLCGNR